MLPWQLLAWIPYLLYWSQVLGIKLDTLSMFLISVIDIVTIYILGVVTRRQEVQDYTVGAVDGVVENLWG